MGNSQTGRHDINRTRNRIMDYCIRGTVLTRSRNESRSDDVSDDRRGGGDK